MDCLTTSQDLLKSENKKNINGFSILEIVASSLIVCFVAVGISFNIANSLVLSVNNNEVVKANNLAKAYIKDQELKWLLQKDYDKAIPVTVDSTYTDSDTFTVNTNTQNLATNDSNQTIIRRLVVSYKNKKGELLSSIFYDFNRPGSLAR